MTKTAVTGPRMGQVVPIRQIDDTIFITPLLEDSKFRELERAGVELWRTDGRPERHKHHGLVCYQLIITTAKEKIEELMQELKAVLAKFGFCVIDEDSARVHLAVIERRQSTLATARLRNTTPHPLAV